MKKVKMKTTGKVGYLTGKKKTRAGKVYHQIFYPYTEEEDKEYEKFWGKKRPKSDKGQYDWQKETMFEECKTKTYQKYITEARKKYIFEVTRKWTVEANSNTDAVNKTKKMKHDEVEVKKVGGIPTHRSQTLQKNVTIPRD